jgi:actin related protein 2/3 complex subunit 1A/1B
VLLRINRAATYVRWSPDETKFAVGSGARVIAVCYFEEENDWWVSKHIKKPLRSTVLSLSWHPNSVLLASGSADAHARVFSAFIKGVDQRPEPTVWGERLPFNTLCGEFANKSGGWVHSVAFSPSGDALAYAAHDSSVTVVYPSAPDQPPHAVVCVTTQMLPFVSLIWTREDQIVAAGHDCHPVVFQGDMNGGWTQAYNIDDPAKRQDASEGAESSALNMFRQMDLKGRTSTAEDTNLKTIHQNTISYVASIFCKDYSNLISTVRPYEGEPGNVTRFSTTGYVTFNSPHQSRQY